MKFNVKNVDGQWQQIHGFVGESFLDALMRGRVDGVMQPHLCMGGDGKCRIVLKDNWFEKVNQ